MAEKQVQAEVVETNTVVEKAKGFWTKFSKPIIYGGSAIILLIGGWYGYKYFVAAPKAQKASETIFPAEKLFGKMVQAGSYSKDTVGTILNGGADGDIKVTGLLSIMKNYSGTPSANLASYMTGACYLHLKEFDKAIKYLKEFDGNGASQIQSAAYRMLGDAYAEQKKNDDALSYYKKAATELNKEDKFLKSYALFLAANFAEKTGKVKDAVELLKTIKADYILKQESQYDPKPPVSEEEVDKLLAKLGVFE